jgi:hypothetical protein
VDGGASVASGAGKEYRKQSVILVNSAAGIRDRTATAARLVTAQSGFS